MDPSLLGEYSAPVALWLHVGGETLELAKVGPDRLTLRHGRKLSSGKAELEIIVGPTTTREEIEINESADTAPTHVVYQRRPRLVG